MPFAFTYGRGCWTSRRPQRAAMLSSLSGMRAYIVAHGTPPERVAADGSVIENHAPVGFSAAVIPFLLAVGENAAAHTQSDRLKHERVATDGLYGRDQRYYDQNLALFSQGWTDGLFHFDALGQLQLRWKVFFMRILFARPLSRALFFAWLLFAAAGALAQSDATKLLLMAKAQTLERRGRIDLAAKVWAQVLLADPSDTQALAGMVRYSQQTGNADAARSYLEKLKKVNPTAHAEAVEQPQGIDPRQAARLNEAGRLAAQQNPEAAMRIYREVLGTNPPEGDLALAYYETLAATSGGQSQAIAHLRDLAKTHPDDSRYTLVLLDVCSPMTLAHAWTD